jgi:hypothetical protein
MYNISRFTITIDNPKFQHWFNNMFNLMNDYRTQQNKKIITNLSMFPSWLVCTTAPRKVLLRFAK